MTAPEQVSETPSMWSGGTPKLQLAWDATSLRALQFCPRYYEYSIIEGFRGSTIDLEFGTLVHQALETFWKNRLFGKSRDDAMANALQVAITLSCSYDDEGYHPWGGVYEQMWRCTGTAKYRNEKGNAAKCPWSHSGKWFPLPAPETCGTCGSTTEASRQWLPTNPAKDRHSLVRLVYAYCSEAPEDVTEGLAPYAFPDGTPAVELPFRIPLPFQTPTGETYLMAGYLDRVATNGDEFFIADIKTTKSTLGKAFFDRFSPSVQMDTYDLAGALLFPELAFTGLVVEGAQVLQGGVRIGRHIIRKSEEQREEYLSEIGDWLNLAEHFAETGHWPMNRASCAMCPFKGICSMKPESRGLYLESSFKRRHWNPLEER